MIKRRQYRLDLEVYDVDQAAQSYNESIALPNLPR